MCRLPTPRERTTKAAVVTRVLSDDERQRRRDWHHQRTARGVCRACPNRVDRFVHCGICRRRMAKIMNFGECEYCWTSLKFAPRIFRYRAVGVDGGKVHPTQKPEALMQWCLGFTKTARTVLDPFMGSGTTLVAAKRLGRRAIGIELEEKYCEIAARRLAQGALPLELGA